MNNAEKYRFILPRKGMKHTCPNCKAKKSFRRYIDTYTGNEIDDECGICDHLNNCGYHIPPRKYFQQHPEKREDWKDKHKLEANWAKVGLDVGKHEKEVEPIIELPDTIPWKYVDKYFSWQSVFMRWLIGVADKRGIPRSEAKRVYEDYHLGALADGRVVFWQITKEGEVRSGKVMKYGDDGHRQGYPNWMHNLLGSCEDVANDYKLNQCLFGEHLLARYPDRDVALVESEKSALVCSLLQPDKVWVASGGCKQLNVEKLSVLIGRHVIIYPDSGEFVHWYRLALKLKDLDFDIRSELERYPPNTDIADVLLKE